MKYFIIPSIVVLLVITMYLPMADAERTQVITPLGGSKVPGCELLDTGCFVPNVVQVEVGTKIIFRNTDIAAHSFTSDKFDSQLMIKGMEHYWFAEVGTTEYYCILHPWTTGTIIGFFAPPIESLEWFPAWVPNIFIWYNNDQIDYDTFIAALQWLMSYDIVIPVGSTPSNAEIQALERGETTSGETTTGEKSTAELEWEEACANAKGVNLRKKLGCDLPYPTSSSSSSSSSADKSAAELEWEEACANAKGVTLRKKLGCDSPYPSSGSGSSEPKTAKEIQCEGVQGVQLRRSLGCDLPPDDSPTSAKTAKEIQCETIYTKKMRAANGCPP